jgi:glycosyltransferase involved in cell wall biosynthesis
MANLSICITVWNEHAELALLLEQLYPCLGAEDEIILQGDQGKVTPKVVSVVREYINRDNFVYLEYPLNRDFATYKNNCIKQAEKDYIFWLDADELFSADLLEIYRQTIVQSPDTQAFAIPRANVVIGLENTDVEKWRWSVKNEPRVIDFTVPQKYGITEQPNFVNWPDYQFRLWKNHMGICYNGTVHERLVGFKNYAYIEPELDFALWHVKRVERQRSQNAFYENCLQ